MPSACSVVCPHPSTNLLPLPAPKCRVPAPKCRVPAPKPRGPHPSTKPLPLPAPISSLLLGWPLQNVMLQIGLNLLSLDGVAVKSVRQYVLKCDACYE